MIGSQSSLGLEPSVLRSLLTEHATACRFIFKLDNDHCKQDVDCWRNSQCNPFLIQPPILQMNTVRPKNLENFAISNGVKWWNLYQGYDCCYFVRKFPKLLYPKHTYNFYVLNSPVLALITVYNVPMATTINQNTTLIFLFY